jgi:hypothetical protein
MGAQLTVAPPDITTEGGRTTVSAEVSVTGAAPQRIWYRCPVDSVTEEQAVDAFFVLALVPAMGLGATLTMPAPVSRDLLRGAETFQVVFQQWYPGQMLPVEIEAEARADTLTPATAVDRGLLSCFTGGVDAFYSALHPPRPLSGLLFVHGFDIPLRDREFRATVARRLRRAARGLGTPLVEVQTNLRRLTNGRAQWPAHMHGSALASVGILLAQRYDAMLVPSSVGSDQIWAANGSHEVTDRLHGTEYFSVVHHASATSRIAKTEAIARNPVAARHLRVCFKTRTGYNCGTCFKCHRTLLDLHAVNLRKRVRSFPPESPSRAELVESIVIDDRNPVRLAQASLAHIRAHGGPADIERALARAIRAHELAQLTARLRELADEPPGMTDDERTALHRTITRVTTSS